MMIAPVQLAIAKAMQAKDGRYAALTHAGYNALSKKASKGNVAPRCYCHLQGFGTGLADLDPRWLQIEKVDANGFRGFTAWGPLKLRPATKKKYSPEGVKDVVMGELKVCNSAVVCFESAKPSEGGRVLHTAVAYGGNRYVLPPLTLLEVVSVQEESFEYLAGRVIKQKLITVRPTFLLPQRGAAASRSRIGSSKVVQRNRMSAKINSCKNRILYRTRYCNVLYYIRLT
jgi:hypothetical protein